MKTGWCWLILVVTALHCTGCSGELSVIEPVRTPADSLETGLIFARGLRGMMSVGDRDTVSVCWEYGIPEPEEPLCTRLGILSGSGHIQIDTIGSRYSVRAVSDGAAVLRAGIGDHYRDFPVSVVSSLPEDGFKQYISSARIGIGGIPEGRVLAAYTYRPFATLDGKGITGGHLFLDESQRDIEGESTRFSVGQHILLAEAEIDEGNTVLYRRFAIEAWQKDCLVMYADLIDDSSDKVSNAALFLSGIIPGEDSSVKLEIRLNAGKSSTILFSDSLTLSHGITHMLATYWDAFGFVRDHITSSFAIDIALNSLDEYHLLAVDCSPLVAFANQIIGKDVPFRINGVYCPDGRYDPYKSTSTY